jgi:hypothetical protein
VRRKPSRRRPRRSIFCPHQKAIRVVRYCLKVRNQYAHWVWWDDYSGKLAFANLEELAKLKRPVKDLTKLKTHHVDATLLAAQEAYFVYADAYLAWINYESRARDGGLRGGNVLAKPNPMKGQSCDCEISQRTH